MELQTTNTKIDHESTRLHNKSSKFRSRRAAQGRRNGQLRQKTIIQIRKDLYERFQQFNMAQCISKIYGCFEKSIGRHSVISYSKQYNFKQQWQVSNRQQNKQQYRTSFIYGILNFVLLMMVNFCIWGISVKIFFQIQNSEWIYLMVCVISILKILNSFLKNPNSSIIIKLKKDYKQLICIVLSILSLIQQKHLDWVKYLGIVVLVLFYFKAQKLYSHIKIFYISSKRRQMIQIIELFSLLIFISHIFALILYWTTHISIDSNWMTKINIQNEDWITKYIYSLYFACTTLLTVGYGDVSPTNIVEILTILLTQLIGIATFAYTVNKIGVTLSNITQRSQKLQKDLGNVETIGNQHRLKSDIICRMRTQLIKQKNLQTDLNINQQNQLFSKFSEDLRQHISVESSMRVIKRSMFMIGNWTGKLQSKIARKLVKQIYAVQQILPQHDGKEKIYILDKGKVDIINNSKQGFKKCFQKTLKSLIIQPNSQVLVQNVYGYSAVISDRKIRLNAVAKTNCICYSLSKADLYELLTQSQQDLEHFHEIKSKIELSKIPEQIEAPSIINFREHYCPSVHYIITQNYHLEHAKNERKKVVRNNRRIKTRIPEQKIAQMKNMSNRSWFNLGNYRNDEHQSSLCIKVQQTWQQKQIHYSRQYSSSKFNNYAQNEIIGFEACKQYQRYYKKANYQNVLNRLMKKIYSGNLYTRKTVPGQSRK